MLKVPMYFPFLSPLSFLYYYYYISMAHLLSLMNLYEYIITIKVYIVFRFPLFLSKVPFLFLDPTQDTTLHLVVMHVC